MSYSFSQPYFVCDKCNVDQPLSTYHATQVAENSLQESDIPLHCGISMRLTVLEKTLDLSYLSDLQTITSSMVSTIKLYLQQTTGSPNIVEQFGQVFHRKLDLDQSPEVVIGQLRELLSSSAREIGSSDTEIAAIVGTGELVLNNFLRNALARMEAGTNPLQRSGPILPGTQPGQSIEFVCVTCQESVEVDPELRQEILSSDEEVELPMHHGQPVQIRIIQHQEDRPQKPQSPSSANYDFFSSSNVEEMSITSVGIDIGSSTSHLIFSRLDLRREVGFLNMTNRFNIVGREILFESNIINTPLIDPSTIDIEAVIAFCQREYERAGCIPEDIDTGAVIVTGETAKKENAAEIVNRLSDEAGKFVSAVAGPNFESMLAAMGSGATSRSMELQNVILNVDIGGGTSNLALVSRGKVVETSCINVGGRLLGIDTDFVIWRIDPPTQVVMKHLGLTYQVGDHILEDDVKSISQIYTNALIEVMHGPATSSVAKKLMMTSDIAFDHHPKVDEILFSGGVAEMIYGDVGSHQDIGSYLAQIIRDHQFGQEVIKPSHMIRATVIGAGSYSVAISGSTIFYDDSITFPLANIPALVVDVNKENFTKLRMRTEIKKAFEKYDISEGEELVALYFDDPIYARDMFLPDFVASVEESLPTSVANKQLIILVFKTDVGGTIGRWLRKETQITDNFICLDEIELKEGDWIDIGMPFNNGDTFPVTVKSLVFN